MHIRYSENSAARVSVVEASCIRVLGVQSWRSLTLSLSLLLACTGQLEHVDYLTKGPWVQIQRFVVPKFVGRGLNASLECDYQVLQDARLYSLKWYKGSSQFYQYIPSKTPTHASFSVEGLKQHQVRDGVVPESQPAAELPRVLPRA
ncbi:uncharacterized protein LOC126991729 [Eriocheir sinensis]|uniref:uncharacterized protein LOC126991729 n=1 Tax=Eriocheir sinensis TaxID=95602 RepID=UPI0021CA5874|nr:uncharacterized protein LOC126991729 [Eriocheir sinensis]